MGRCTGQEQRIAAVRKRDYLLKLACYCDGPDDCPVREVTIRVKDHDRDPRLAGAYKGLRCPLCGSVLKLHDVLDRGQVFAAAARAARGAVAVQMYERDHDPGSGLCAVPVSVFIDDRLPPTPAGWWERRPEGAPA